MARKGASGGVAGERARRGLARERASGGVAREGTGRGVRKRAGRGRHLRGPQDGDARVGAGGIVPVFVLQQTHTHVQHAACSALHSTDVRFLVVTISPRGLTFTWWGCCGLCLI